MVRKNGSGSATLLSLLLVLVVLGCGDDKDGGEPAPAAADDAGDAFGNASDPPTPSSPITPGSGGDHCLTEFALCELAATDCCEGFDCVVDPELGTRCRRPCERDGQCEAEACVEAGVGDATYCAYSGAGGRPLPAGQCVQAGEDCDERRSCCTGLSCVTADGSELDGCQPSCTQDTECDSSCCRKSMGRTSGFCAPARFCSCAPLDAACGGFEPLCCDGLACSSDGAGMPTCKPQCQDDGDCESQCCAPISGTDERVCVAAERCG